MTAHVTFRVSSRVTGRRRTITVHLYATVEQMRAAATAYTRRHGTHYDGQFASAAGVTHTSESLTYDADGTPHRRSTAAGIIRLAQPHIGTSVIVHEAVHAASGIYRQDHQPGHGHVEDDMDNEEVLAYLIGDITRRIVDRLYHYGAYTRAQQQP